jgi:hypothetical protein
MSKTPRKDKTTFDARDQEIVGLKELLNAAKREREAALGGKARAESDRQSAFEALEKARADVKALKGELAAAHATIARQAGYLDRVKEDDSIKEGAERDVSHVEMSTVPMRLGPTVSGAFPVTVEMRRREWPADMHHGGLSVEGRAEKPWWER